VTMPFIALRYRKGGDRQQGQIKRDRGRRSYSRGTRERRSVVLAAKGSAEANKLTERAQREEISGCTKECRPRRSLPPPFTFKPKRPRRRSHRASTRHLNRCAKSRAMSRDAQSQAEPSSTPRREGGARRDPARS
jgi:hypothetical protein